MTVANKSVEKQVGKYHLYDSNGKEVKLEQSEGKKNIGVLVDDNLPFAKFIQAQVDKTNRILGLIRRTYTR